VPRRLNVGTKIAQEESMKKRYYWLVGLALLLVAFRISLPFLLENRINNRLSSIDGYYGQVKNVDIQLYRGGFRLDQLSVYEKASADTDIPIVDLPSLDFSIQWKSLLKGRFVGEVYLDSLKVNFTQRRKDADTMVDSIDQRINLIRELQKLNPIQINIIEVTNGSVSYINPQTDPTVDISLHNFRFRAENLGNVLEPSEKLPASVLLDAATLDSGMVHLDAQLNYLITPPDFNFDFKMERIDIPRFNDFLEAYANLGVEAGSFNLYAEGKARNGALKGYSKPLIVGLEISPADSSDGLFQKIYEGAIDLGTDVFENGEKDQIGTRIPFSGRLDERKTGALQALYNFLKNAFFEAYKKELERSIKFGSSDSKTPK
jgi:hypothetical protein